MNEIIVISWIPNHTVAYDDLLYSVFCDAFCHGIKNKKEMIKNKCLDMFTS